MSLVAIIGFTSLCRSYLYFAKLDRLSLGQVISKILGPDRVHFFSSATLALKKLDEIKPNVIICDVVMPNMNGVDVYKILQQKGYQDHTFLITGGAINNQLSEELTQLAPSIMYKPFTVQSLRDKVWKTHLKVQANSEAHF